MTSHALLLAALLVPLWVAPAHGDKEREEGSRQLGADVRKADIDVADSSVDVELLRESTPHEVAGGSAEMPPARDRGGERVGRRLPRALENRLVSPASLRYTIGIIVLMGLGLLASIVTLCLPSVQARERKSTEQ